jgi:hypothetical protein
MGLVRGDRHLRDFDSIIVTRVFEGPNMIGPSSGLSAWGDKKLSHLNHNRVQNDGLIPSVILTNAM